MREPAWRMKPVNMLKALLRGLTVEVNGGSYVMFDDFHLFKEIDIDGEPYIAEAEMSLHEFINFAQQMSEEDFVAVNAQNALYNLKKER